MLDDVVISPLCGEQNAYVKIEPRHAGLDLVQWASAHRDALNAILLEAKAIVFRDFRSQDAAAAFSSFSNAFSEPLQYVYRSTPRTSVGQNMYTATEFPKQYTIPVHCENAYQRSWPMKLFFFCQTAASEGGETPLADIAAVTQQLRPDVVATFVDKQVMYVRNFGSGIDLSWQVAFQTSRKEDVGQYCDDNGIGYVWKNDKILRTHQVRPAMAHHPVTGANMWFNQAHLFNVYSLDAATRTALLNIFAPADLPRNAYYGDGSEIDADSVSHIQQTFDRCTSTFAWQQGDILMVDNMQVAHGRKPFAGERKVLVMMGDLHHGVP